MAGWSPDIQDPKSDVSGLLQLVSYVNIKVKAGSGRRGRRRRYAAAADKFDTPPPPINFDRRAECQIFV